MFSSLLFKQIPCPTGPCKLTNCLFSHEQTLTPGPVQTVPTSIPLGRGNGDLKRRRLNNSTMERTPAMSKTKDTSELTVEPLLTPSSSSSSSSSALLPSDPISTGYGSSSRPFSTTTRPVSPPQPTRTAKAALRPTPNGVSKLSLQPPKKTEYLTPRMVKSGGPFQQRLKALKALHADLVRLNNELKKNKDVDNSSLVKSDNELITMALDRESDANVKGAGLYQGLISQKLILYRKMKLEDWVKEILALREEATKVASGTSKTIDTEPLKQIETGLTHSEELQMLERFVLSPQQMSQAQFILTAPTPSQIEEAQQVQHASGNYETCDRCSSRFQVLTQPNDGKYTTNGRCVHHWGRAVFPARQKTDFATGPKEALYSCCNLSRGSPGCSTQNDHVFKVGGNSPGRLASVLQFETTPLNTNVKVGNGAVAYDCEMGYTTVGLEVIRLSACKWPSAESLIDVLVKPIGTMLDLNTKFSGVTPRQFAEAIPYSVPEQAETPPLPTKTVDDKQIMRIVDSPAAARELLTTFISPNTVLIGHAIDNDLNVLRLLHPTIVDTSLLFPHHGGLPYRFPLRKLAKDFLNLDIQQTSATGHDSMEDSRATGELVRIKVQREWEKFRRMGWHVEDGKFYLSNDGKKEERALPPFMESQGTVKKRKQGAFEVAEYKVGSIGETARLAGSVEENGQETSS